jgi:two-component system LytT family sensor kinase
MPLSIKITRKGFFTGWAIWTVWAVLYSIVLSIGSHVPFMIALMSGFISYYPLALYSILVLAFCRKYRLEAHHIIPFILIHFMAALIFAVSWQAVDYLICWLLWREAAFFYRPLDSVGAFMVYNGILIYALLAGIFYTSGMFRQYREKELKASQLQMLNKESELKALKAQLNPHFLFNTLNTIFALIDPQSQKAKSTVTDLSELLRYSLAGINQDFVPLEKEIDAAKTYLGIEKARFGDRLQVQYHIDPQAINVRVPPMILQPLAENAVKHGISSSKEKGKIEISARLSEGLEIIVKNTGKDVSSGSEKQSGNGIGLRNLKQRLQHIYGDRAVFIAGPQASGGYVVRIVLKAIDTDG